jgi:hypothetical protein
MTKMISFGVTEELKRKATQFAELKGFKNASNLAHYALVQYISRYSTPKCQDETD